MRERPKPPLLWRVFLVNGVVLGIAVLLLIVTPFRINSSIALGEALVLLAALAVMLAANFVLLQRALRPLQRLVRVMETVDPMHPGRRIDASEGRDAEVAGLALAFNAMLDRLEVERRESAARALAAQEAERRRIAQELHDQVGQTLTAAGIQVERARSASGNGTAVGLDTAAEAIRLTLEDVRRIGRELRPEALDDLGLANALIALSRRLENQSGVRIERDLAHLPPLAPEQELVVYRVAQEALTNVIRHALAANATLSLRAEGDELLLTVADDGRGLSLPQLGDGTGIAGMRERAMLAGGTLALESVDEGGTTVRLRLPLAPAHAEGEA